MTLDPLIGLAVLVAAALHATWSALVKSGGDPLLNIVLVAGGSMLIALPLVFLVPLPTAEGWAFLAASVLVHALYYAATAWTYRIGDLSHVYTIMRGTPPFAVALAAPWLTGETLSPGAWLGIGLICCGILALGGVGPGGLTAARPAATGRALATAATIACYTLIDGLGVRNSGSAPSYIVWMFLLNAAPIAVAAFALRGRRTVLAHLSRHWRRGLVGGACSMAAYAIVLWAMTLAPIAPVAALRETSVIFAALIGVLLLGEPLGRRRVAAACVVAAGAIVLKLAP